jgi:hypothetical protein
VAEHGREESEAWLSELLDAAAEEYEPDADRLTAMVAARIAQQGEKEGAGATRRARAGRSRRRGLGLLGRLGLAGIPAGVALSTIGAAAAIAVGATATIAVTSSHDRHTVTVAAPTTSPGTGGASSPGASPSEGASAAATTESTHPAASTSGTPISSSSSALVAATSSIATTSNGVWSELDLAVTVKQRLTALHVTVKVSKCEGLANTGSFDTVGSTFTVAATKGSDGSITYEFDLAKGDTIAPGEYTFAAQFQHASAGWKAQDDTYYVSARTATSTSASSASGAY